MRCVLQYRRRAAWLMVCAAVCLTLAAALPASAQEPAGEAAVPFPQASPEDFGLLLPDAPPQPAADRRVLVQDGAGEVVVANVHVEVGDRLVVVLPNGRLISVPTTEATATERPFEPATKEELAEELLAKFPGFKTRSTKRYLYVYNASDPFYTATSRILETMYPALLKYFQREKFPVDDPATPLIVIAFRTEDEFTQYHQMPEGVVAYYNGVTNYVVMYEQSDLADIAPDLAVKQSISTIAHEGVHQILHNIGVQQRLSRWPMWISEGLPEYFAPTQADKRVRWKGVGLVNDLRMHNLIQLFDARPPGTPGGDLVRMTVEAESLNANGYAASWGLTHYLAKGRKKEFFEYLREVSRFGPLEQRNGAEVELFVGHYGDDYGALEENMVKALEKLDYVDPIANQTHYVATIDFGGQRRVMVTTSPTEVKQVLAQSPGAEVNVQAYPNKNLANRAANAALGR